MVFGGDSRSGSGAPQGKGSGDLGFTDERGELLPTVPKEDLEDAGVIRRARQIAVRLSIRRPTQDRAMLPGTGRLASLRYTGGSDEIDVDATLARLVENPFFATVGPDDADIIVRDRRRTRRSVVLAVDVSGSMRGERIRTAAATVGALAGELAQDRLGVLAFWSDAAVVLPLGAAVRPQRLLETLLRIPAKGLTNVGFPLQVAATQLARVPARDARVVLLSDCVHNAGPDPRDLAARLPRLDVLLDVTGEHDEDFARELARIGRGRLGIARTYRDVGPALSTLFAA
jgi:Mg-chelatase subunit ChlD